MGQIFPLCFTAMDVASGRERYLACYRDAWRGAHGSLTGFDERAIWRSAVMRAQKSPDALTEAWLEDSFAGVIALDDQRGRWYGAGWIAFCYVAPEHRGKGVGRALIERAAGHYRALCRRTLRLTVAPGNPAVDFYKHLGFTAVGTEPGAVEDLIVMERGL